jgi:hypothetical protein
LNSPVFEWVAQQLEEATALSRLEARGTVRLALREVGLTVTGVARRPMLFVLEKILPGLLRSRNIGGARETCNDLMARLSVAELGNVAESPEEVFARMGGDLDPPTSNGPS